MDTRTAISTISRLLLDLATELDLHYDDKDMHALTESFTLIKAAVSLLAANGASPHPDVLGIVGRYNRCRLK